MKTLILQAIHSGGQTGADQGGLHGGYDAGLTTGGFVPKDYWTETGSNPSLMQYGVICTNTRNYKYRTEANVENTDGTVIFGKINSPGSQATKDFTDIYKKPMYAIPWKTGEIFSETEYVQFRLWLIDNQIKVLNVAGNRESGNPGICKAVSNFIITVVNRG